MLINFLLVLIFWSNVTIHHKRALKSASTFSGLLDWKESSHNSHLWNKAVLEPRVSPAFAITFFCIHCNILDLKIHQSMWIHWPFFPKTWTKGHWPLDDLWPHVCWGHICDSTQGSLCPSPMTIHQCMWIQWSILQNTTYIHIHTYTYILRTEWVIT